MAEKLLNLLKSKTLYKSIKQLHLIFFNEAVFLWN